MARYLITADPAHTIRPKVDSTLLIARELLSRGHEVDYSDLFECNLKQSAEGYLAQIPSRKILSVDPQSHDFIKLENLKTRAISEYNVALHRKDPPVDDFFKKHMNFYSKAPISVLQINNPLELIRHSEKELATFYPQFSIPTVIASSFKDFEKAVRAQKAEAVAKPFNERSGNGVEFFKPDVSVGVLKKYWEERKPKVVVQPYLDEITKSGDLRIYVVNGQIIGSVLRVPKKGSRLGNLDQGAIPAPFTPTARQLEATRQIAESLKPRALFMLGLDFIGEYLSEINVTSPSALVEINQVMGICAEKVLVDEIEKLRLKGGHGN